jgi:UDPglucose--hexose-1-phosphate uridylyltransferase
MNPLTGEWVLVSPHRTERPWLGQLEAPAAEALPAHDPACYLCPGNPRAGGVRNPDYRSTFVFENDYPALLEDTARGRSERHLLLRAEAEPGTCRVVCYSPRHDLPLARLPLEAIARVVDCWCEEVRELEACAGIGYVQVFENRGAMMGASNPHPHGQIWASASLPNEVEKERRCQREHLRVHGSCLLCELLALELELGERIVCANEGFVALVPFWAVWPFEALVLPRRHRGSLEELDPGERLDLAAILRALTARYDNLFRAPFPYSMGIHGRPPGEPDPGFHLHLHLYPPLLRSATVRKFMVGYELLGTPQRDLTAESAAARLRALPERHYLES